MVYGDRLSFTVKQLLLFDVRGALCRRYAGTGLLVLQLLLEFILLCIDCWIILWVKDRNLVYLVVFLVIRLYQETLLIAQPLLPALDQIYLR